MLRIAAVVDPASVGYPVIGDVLIDVAPGRIQEVAAGIAELENVSYVAGSVGDGDLSVQVCARDTEELLRLVNEVIGKVEGATRTRTVMVPWKLKDVYEWDIPQENGAGVVATAASEGDGARVVGFGQPGPAAIAGSDVESAPP